MRLRLPEYGYERWLPIRARPCSSNRHRRQGKTATETVQIAEIDPEIVSAKIGEQCFKRLEETLKEIVTQESILVRYENGRVTQVGVR